MPTPSRGPGRPRSPINTKTPAGKIAQRIRRAREKAGLSVEEAAERVGISAKTWWDYESARYTPSLATIQRVAKVCGVGVSDLL